MKYLSRISILFLAIGCVASQAATLQAQDHDAMIAAADNLDAQFVAAFNSGDTDALAGLYWKSPDLVSFPPGNFEDRGYEAVISGYGGFLKATPGAKLEVAPEGHIVAGKYVVTFGTFTMAFPTPDGGTHETKGRFTDVKTEKDGKWVYVHDHASVPLPPPPAPSDG